jgi:thiol-disulfide isomerase/thioredoxin
MGGVRLFLFTLISFLLSLSYAGSIKSKVPSVSAAELSEYIPATDKHTLILIYSDTCPHCTKFMPIFEEFYLQYHPEERKKPPSPLPKPPRSDLVILRANGKSDREIIRHFPEVSGYPTLIYIAPGQSKITKKFTSDRTVEKLNEFVNTECHPEFSPKEIEEIEIKLEEFLDNVEEIIEIRELTDVADDYEEIIEEIISGDNTNSDKIQGLMVKFIGELGKEFVELKNKNMDLIDLVGEMSKRVNGLENKLDKKKQGECGKACKAFYAFIGFVLGMAVLYFIRRRVKKNDTKSIV